MKRMITWLMRKVEKDFGSNIMLKLHVDASVEVGHTIGPLDAILKDMLNMECGVKKVHGVVQCGKKLNDEIKRRSQADIISMEIVSNDLIVKFRVLSFCLVMLYLSMHFEIYSVL